MMRLKTLKTLKVPGFVAGGMAVGIKKKGIPDLALIVSETPATAAGVFTLNQVCSPTVTLSRDHLKRARTVRAVIANSGNANACTGPRGMVACRRTTEAVARTLDVSPKEVLVASTGVIGVPLPVEKIETGVPVLVEDVRAGGWADAASAIMTTDLVPKWACVQYGDIVIGGIAKGSGMIHPNMATMLSFLATNAAITKGALTRALKTAADATFNKITVDGETSTNDMVLILANGQAGNTPLKEGSPAYKNFVTALTQVCRTLAFKIVEDGEGATKFVTIRVTGAKSEADATRVAKTVAHSKLVQTALFGADPNWGRIICAVGYAGVPLNAERIDISLNKIALVRRGAPVPKLSTATLRRSMKRRNIAIDIGLNLGRAEAEVYTCDLSYDYVRINAEYTT